MKWTLFIIVSLLLGQYTNAKWPKLFGHSTYDAIGRDISNSYDNGILFVGAERLSVDGTLDGYVRKTDINGTEIWKRYFISSNAYTILAGISSSSDGSTMLSGQIWSYDNVSNGYVVKINECGEKEWCKIFNIPGYSLCLENKKLPDGSYIILAGHDTYSYDRIWLYRLDLNGDLLWQKSIEPDTNYFNETGYDLLLTYDSCILVTGFTYSIREPNLGWPTPFWVKMNLDGNQQWALPWITTTHNVGDFGRTRQDSYGNFYSVGNYGSDIKQNACIYKFTSGGDTIKKTTVFDEGDGSIVQALEFYQDSTLFLGVQWGIGNTGYSKVLRCDTTGNVINSMNVPLDGMTINYSALSPDNKILGLSERFTNAGYPHWETCLFKFNQNMEYDSAYSVPRNYDSLCSGVIIPEETFNLDCEIVSIDEPAKAAEASFLKIYPNPASGIVTISIPDYFVDESKAGPFKIVTTFYKLAGEKQIEIMDMSVRVIETKVLPDQQKSINFDVSHWPAGMYMARLVNKGKVRATGKLIKFRKD